MTTSRFYATAWRWHFYSGLYVAPFLLMLAVTGLVMVFFTGFQSRLGMLVHVAPQPVSQSISVQAKAALDTVPGAVLKEYIAPKAPNLAAWFVLVHDGKSDAVAVNPFTASVIQTVDKDNTVFAWAEKIHGTLLIGDVGDRLIEVAAGLGIVMIVTGLYLFWPRQSAWSEVLIPDWKAKGRKWWKSLHTSLGFWISVVLFFFLLSGMAWTGVWGGKLVQPFATFPAQKWDAVPTSEHADHATMNTPGLHEVPWGLEQTPMPESGSATGTAGIPEGQAVNLDSVAALAHGLGYAGQFHINAPQDHMGVYTITADSMSGDLENPFKDRTVHIDRYSGKVLAEAAFADYSLIAKAMAVGIALHQGDLGLWSAMLNVVFCLSVVLLCVSGIVMWWVRRPKGYRLGAPTVPAQAPLWKTGAVVMLVTALAFPLAGGVLLAVLLLDWLVVSRVRVLKTALR